jgi:hypothetical protein
MGVVLMMMDGMGIATRAGGRGVPGNHGSKTLHVPALEGAVGLGLALA